MMIKLTQREIQEVSKDLKIDLAIIIPTSASKAKNQLTEKILRALAEHIPDEIRHFEETGELKVI